MSFGCRTAVGYMVYHWATPGICLIRSMNSCLKTCHSGTPRTCVSRCCCSARPSSRSTSLSPQSASGRDRQHRRRTARRQSWRNQPRRFHNRSDRRRLPARGTDESNANSSSFLSSSSFMITKPSGGSRDFSASGGSMRPISQLSQDNMPPLPRHPLLLPSPLVRTFEAVFLAACFPSFFLNFLTLPFSWWWCVCVCV